MAGCANASNIESLPIEQNKEHEQLLAGRRFSAAEAFEDVVRLIRIGSATVIAAVGTGSSSSSLLLDHNILGNTRPAGRMCHARPAAAP